MTSSSGSHSLQLQTIRVRLTRFFLSSGQESFYTNADSLLFGRMPHPPAGGKVENAETKGAENRHVFRTLPGRSCAKEDIGQGAANERPASLDGVNRAVASSPRSRASKPLMIHTVRGL